MRINKIEDYIIYEDKEILVCHKPAGIAVQNSRIGAEDMESALKNHLAIQQPGKMPYLGIVHRLDQPVEGVLVFAKTKKAAAGLSKQITEHRIVKEYLAVTTQSPQKKTGHLEDFLQKDAKTNTSAVVAPKTANAKKAVLDYEVLQEIEDIETGKRILVKVILDTGRHHQIRVQMAHAGMPLLGDRKYNQKDNFGTSLGLCSCHLVFSHPITGKKMEFRVQPEGNAFRDFEKMS